MQNDDKSFFEKMGEILNTPLPGTVAKQNSDLSAKKEAAETDDSLLARIKEILNTPLPGSAVNQTNDAEVIDIEKKALEITEADVQENWWETDWAEFKAHQDQDRKGLTMKQQMDQENFAHYQALEREQFESYQSTEFELFQAQQQAKLVWIQEQQFKQAMGVEVSGMLPPAPPVAPLAPKMPTPPWVV